MNVTDKAKELNEKVAEILLDAEGVNSTGISSCNNEICIVITTETEEAENALKTLYPEGARIDGILVEVENVGEIVAQ